MNERPDSAPGHSREKAYSKTKLRLSIADIVLNLVIIGFLAFSGISPLLVDLIGRFAANEYLMFLLFIVVIGTLYSVAQFPFDFYGGYVVEHRFGLSNQTAAAWFIEKIKGSAVGIVIGVPVAIMFFFLLRAAGWYWWVYFGFFVFFVSVFLARVAPVLIFPLFYTFREIESEEVRGTVMALLKDQGITARGVFTFNLSKDTKKANAGFTGIGRSKRIILSDTLLDRFSPAEIAVVFAHELGHYRKRHIVKSISHRFGEHLSFIFFLRGALPGHPRPARLYVHAWEIAAIPILLFYLTLFSLAIMPVSNALSRKFEREADSFALKITGDRDSFVSSMEKLAELNLADRDPNPVTEFMFYSHPSIKKTDSLRAEARDLVGGLDYSGTCIIRRPW